MNLRCRIERLEQQPPPAGRVPSFQDLRQHPDIIARLLRADSGAELRAITAEFHQRFARGR